MAFVPDRPRPASRTGPAPFPAKRRFSVGWAFSTEPAVATARQNASAGTADSTQWQGITTMGQHTAAGAIAQKARRAAAVLLTAGALVSAGGGSAFADVLSDTPLSGQLNTDQDGEQNLDCGNSARLVRLNIGKTVRRERVCVDTDGHTRRHSGHPSGARAVGGATLGPQVNTAQTGRQNLNCGNSADTLTVNVLGTMHQETTCVAVDGSRSPGRDRGHGHGEHIGDAGAEGGHSVGQVNTAQTGRQNLNCGNSADTATVNVLGTIRKHTTCVAADHSHRAGPATVHRGQASAGTTEVVGSETNTAQNGRQNQNCGNPGTLVDLPLGHSERETRCTVRDSSSHRTR